MANDVSDTNVTYVPENKALASSLDWIRDYRIKIYHHTQAVSTNSKNAQSYYQEFAKEKNTDKVLDVSDLRVQFQIRRCAMYYPNQAVISIYNLSAETENSIIQEGYRVIVEAGYKNGICGQIFDGTVIMYTRAKVNGTDFVLNILAIDGDQFLNEGFCSFTYAKGQTARQVVNNICNKASSPVSLGYASPSLDKIVMSKGGAVYGQPKKTLADIAKTINGTWFIDNGKLYMFSYSDSANKVPSPYNRPSAVELNPLTGLLGNPQQVNYGVQARCLLNPKLTPYGLIHIASKYITEQMAQIGSYSQGITFPYTLDPNGIYRICSITFTGDTRGNEWYSDITAVDQGGNVMSMLTNPSYTAN
ncbi:MAG TPA: hypothetical protein DG942_02090 [Ruminococcaceae bacterium]|jgi:hypothetical protein|nr:hypothetical protein [Oscillospiraceae bacterium]